MPKFATPMDILEVAAAGAIHLLPFPDDYDMTRLVEQLRMMRRMDEINEVLDQIKEVGLIDVPPGVYTSTTSTTTATA